MLIAAVLFLYIIIIGALPLVMHWRHKQLDLFTSFGAGVLLSAGFFHMLPDAIELLHAKASLFTALGFFSIFVVEKFVLRHNHGHAPCHHNVGPSALIGLSVHSIISNFALGISLKESSSLAWVLLSGVMIHKLPETLALSALLLSSGWSRLKCFSGILFFACMGPLGILTSNLAQYFQSNKTLSIAMAISAGTFIYIGAIDLLPTLYKKGHKQHWNWIVFILGLLLLIII